MTAGEARVVIVGAGPVGLTAAVSLARLDVPVTVLEAGEQLSSESRASTFHPSSLELLAELGVVEPALARGLKVESLQFRDREHGLVAALDYSVIADETSFPFRLQLEQSKMTALLLERLHDFPNAEVLFGHRVVGLEDAARGARVHADTADGDVAFDAPIVVGADGASSAVRHALGTSFEGTTYPERFLVMSTNFDFFSLWDDIALVNYVSDPRQWFALLRTPDHWRLTIPIRAGDDPGSLSDLDALEAQARGIVGVDTAIRIVHANIYNVHRRIAGSFVRPPVVLIGDAAHVNNPTGGLGMNSGILDAFFLAPALRRALAGDAAALRDFGDRHRDLALNVVGHYSNATWVALSQTDEVARRRWRDEISQLATDTDQVRAYLKEISLLNALGQLRGDGAS